MGKKRSLLRPPCDRERRTSKDSCHGCKQRATLFAHRGKIAADDTKGCSPVGTAKGASNFLLHFRHAQIALRLVVRKRNPQIVEDGQDLLGPCEQGIQQILGLALFGSPCSLPRCSTGWRGLSSVASG